jgi:hypothetical protein
MRDTIRRPLFGGEIRVLVGLGERGSSGNKDEESDFHGHLVLKV